MTQQYADILHAAAANRPYCETATDAILAALQEYHSTWSQAEFFAFLDAHGGQSGVVASMSARLR